MMQQWFKDAKLGIFIHWGIYGVQKRGGESWPIVNAQVSHTDYMTQMKDFTAEKYDPEAWADLIVRAGAKYAVLTTKHHDGVTLWPTKENSPSIPAQSPAGKDMVGPYLDAIRKRDLKAGLYFSHTDWSNLPHMQVITGQTEEKLMNLRKEKINYRELWTKDQEARDLSNSEEHQKLWADFLTFHRAQLKEILTSWGDIDLLWFDVMLGRNGFDYKCGELKDFIQDISDKTVINSRLRGHGDYETPEQAIPIVRPKGPWEFCVTTNNTWSYTGSEEQYKTPYQIICMLCECIGMGGNMLLNVGPAPDGTVPEQQVILLEELGKWVRKHEEAVYGTIGGFPPGHAYGPTAMNKEKNTLYLYLFHKPNGPVSIQGIRNAIKKITVLGDGVECPYSKRGGAKWMNIPGTMWIDVPESSLDENATVLKIELDGEIDLYHDKGVEIDIN
jgi:alpha-L-fucosidase